jgi:hypothetical protein
MAAGRLNRTLDPRGIGKSNDANVAIYVTRATTFE